ncbi:MAG: DUF6531 domain-containing protein, partial [candidate division NC10 bacterium]|nr:DUF6531 domain-containing protein [candidate division NC10 bacterium]
QRFCGVCGLVCWVSKQAGQAVRNLLAALGGEPVDLATGLFISDKTDLLLPGRLPVTLSWSYHPHDPFSGIAGFQPALGPGWSLSVDAILLPVNASLFRLILPGNARLDLVLQPDGTYRNSTHPFLSGAVLTSLSGGDHQLRFKDGNTWRFRNLFLGLEFLSRRTGMGTGC